MSIDRWVYIGSGISTLDIQGGKLYRWTNQSAPSQSDTMTFVPDLEDGVTWKEDLDA